MGRGKNQRAGLAVQIGKGLAVNEVLQQSAATISTIRRIHAPRGACGQETRSAGWVNILA